MCGRGIGLVGLYSNIRHRMLHRCCAILSHVGLGRPYVGSMYAYISFIPSLSVKTNTNIRSLGHMAMAADVSESCFCMNVSVVRAKCRNGHGYQHIRTCCYEFTNFPKYECYAYWWAYLNTEWFRVS